jgi:hypothetical protein
VLARLHTYTYANTESINTTKTDKMYSLKVEKHPETETNYSTTYLSTSKSKQEEYEVRYALVIGANFRFSK